MSATLLFFFGGSVELVWVDVCSFTDEVTWLSREISDELGKGMLRFAGVGEGVTAGDAEGYAEPWCEGVGSD